MVKLYYEQFGIQNNFCNNWTLFSTIQQYYEQLNNIFIIFSTIFGIFWAPRSLTCSKSIQLIYIYISIYLHTNKTMYIYIYIYM